MLTAGAYKNKVTICEHNSSPTHQKKILVDEIWLYDFIFTVEYVQCSHYYSDCSVEGCDLRKNLTTITTQTKRAEHFTGILIDRSVGILIIWDNTQVWETNHKLNTVMTLKTTHTHTHTSIHVSKNESEIVWTWWNCL